MTSSTFEKLQQVAQAVFIHHKGGFEPTYNANDISGWDSLGHISFVLALEEEFGVRLRPAQLAKMASIRDISDHIDTKL